jgi:CubicO group peptidase (beta-lactamase class C family)
MPEIARVKELCRVPSISVGVLHEGEVVLMESLGLRDVERALKANCDTSYLLGSVSKMFASAAVGILVEEGKMSWHDTIQKHLPNFNPAGDPEIGKYAEVFDACRHTTGLGNPNVLIWGPDGTLIGRSQDHVGFMNAASTSNRDEQRFRNWWLYSNQAYGLVSCVVEAVSRSKYSRFLQERLFKPLDMRGTHVSQAEMDSSGNVAFPYAKRMSNGDYMRLHSEYPSKDHGPTLATIGLRSCVRDLLTWSAAVMKAEQKEISSEVASTSELTNNPIKQMDAIWNKYWTRPVDDGFDNQTAYCMGWYRTTMPTGALGLYSYGHRTRWDPEGTYLKYIIGRESKPRQVYGHNGVNNGSTASLYTFPETHSAVVVLSNGCDVGDASDTASQILIQALFDLKPHIDLLPRLEKEVDLCLRDYDNMVADWNKHRDSSAPKRPSKDYIGEYIGHGTLVVSILGNEPETALCVLFEGAEASRCALEHYNKDSYSFFPTSREVWLGRSMLDWDYYKVGIFEFVRDDSDEVIGFRWQWDVDEEPTFFTKRSAGVLGVGGEADGCEEEVVGEREESRGKVESADSGFGSGEREMIPAQIEAEEGGNEGIVERTIRFLFSRTEALTGWTWLR